MAIYPKCGGGKNQEVKKEGRKKAVKNLAKKILKMCYKC